MHTSRRSPARGVRNAPTSSAWAIGVVLDAGSESRVAMAGWRRPRETYVIASPPRGWPPPVAPEVSWSPRTTAALVRVVRTVDDEIHDRPADPAALARHHEARARSVRDDRYARREFADAATGWEHAHEPMQAVRAWMEAGDPTNAVLVWKRAGDPDRAKNEAAMLADQLEDAGQPAEAVQVLDVVGCDELAEAVCRRVLEPFQLGDRCTIELEREERDPETGRAMKAVALLLEPGNPFRRHGHEATGADAISEALQTLLEWLASAADGLTELEQALTGWALRCDGPLPEWRPDGRWEIGAVEVKTGREVVESGRTPLDAYAALRRRVKTVRG